MDHYQRLERPVANESNAVQLKFGLTLQQIMDVVGFFHLSPQNFTAFLVLGWEESNYDDKCVAESGKLGSSTTIGANKNFSKEVTVTMYWKIRQFYHGWYKNCNFVECLFRNGLTITCGGTSQSMETLQTFEFHLLRYGLRISSCTIGDAFFHHYSNAIQIVFIQKQFSGYFDVCYQN